MEEQKKKNSVVRLIRVLHRDIGYLMVGLMVIYALSGLQMIHRGTNFLKINKSTEMGLSPGLTMEEAASELMMRDAQGATTDGDIISFSNGSTYNKATGETVVISSTLIWPFEKFSMLHKTGGSKIGKVFTTTSAIMLCFLAISSFWMFSRKNRNFKRGIVLATIGFAVAFFVVVSNQMPPPPPAPGGSPEGQESGTNVMEESRAIPDMPSGDMQARQGNEMLAQPEGEMPEVP